LVGFSREEQEGGPYMFWPCLWVGSAPTVVSLEQSAKHMFFFLRKQGKKLCSNVCIYMYIRVRQCCEFALIYMNMYVYIYVCTYLYVSVKKIGSFR